MINVYCAGASAPVTRNRAAPRQVDRSNGRQLMGAVTPGDLQNIDAILQVSVFENRELYEEIRRDQDMCQALRELMKDEIAEERENTKLDAIKKNDEKPENISGPGYAGTGDSGGRSGQVLCFALNVFLTF